jgi:hypothetical protein
MKHDRPIQPFNFQADLVWWDIPFKRTLNFTDIRMSLYMYIPCVYMSVTSQGKCDERTWKKPVYFLLWLINLKYNSN